MYKRAGGDALHMYTVVDAMCQHVRETSGLLYTQRSARGEIQQQKIMLVELPSSVTFLLSKMYLFRKRFKFGITLFSYIWH
jgi:hypothetical protein